MNTARWRRLLHLARPRLDGIALSLGLLLIAAAIEVLKPWPMKLLVDHARHVLGRRRGRRRGIVLRVGRGEDEANGDRGKHGSMERHRDLLSRTTGRGGAPGETSTLWA